ncbi:copper chaperone PCu(A)C [Gordonia sp. HY285]|uniref:copper chaperone PCu(A)C n=1 Tax=Gordonia liuliyuniae TaxID=2911517 RepID=UPI001F342B8F|nr:copper chaperone PCu(A)C [Gordonia liuliyuniae]MCF8611513.1 copper chaperone PCu(A)C [Gordonia liuliyuniae]
MARRYLLRSAGLTAFAAAALVSATSITACTPDTDDAADADSVTVSQPWIKASDHPAADNAMTSAFAVVENSSDHDIRIVGASSDVAKNVELHEVVESGGETTMREVDGGIVVPANGSVILDPGGEHFMLMDVTKPIRAGDVATITARFDDGSTETIDALARDFDGNQENYSPSAAAPVEGGAHGGHS